MCPFYRWRHRPAESHKLASGQAPRSRSEALAGKHSLQPLSGAAEQKGRELVMAAEAAARHKSL